MTVSLYQEPLHPTTTIRRRQRRVIIETSMNQLIINAVILITMLLAMMKNGIVMAQQQQQASSSSSSSSTTPNNNNEKDNKKEEGQILLRKSVQINDVIGIERAVLKLGADMEDIQEGRGGGQTALMKAVLLGHVEAVETLINLGADLTTRESMGYTLTHAASFQGRAEVLTLIIDHGVAWNEQHEDGYYPIHRACWGKEPRHTDTVEILLGLEVPLDIKAGNGLTCYEMTKNEGTKRLLEEWNTDQNEEEL